MTPLKKCYSSVLSDERKVKTDENLIVKIADGSRDLRDITMTITTIILKGGKLNKLKEDREGQGEYLKHINNKSETIQ